MAYNLTSLLIEKVLLMYLNPMPSLFNILNELAMKMVRLSVLSCLDLAEKVEPSLALDQAWTESSDVLLK